MAILSRPASSPSRTQDVHNAEEPGLVRLFVALSAESTAADGPARSFFVDRYAAIRSGIAADIRRRQDADEIAGELGPQVVASLLVAAADGLQIQWLLDPDAVDMGARLEQLLTALLGSASGQAMPAPAQRDDPDVFGSRAPSDDL